MKDKKKTRAQAHTLEDVQQEIDRMYRFAQATRERAEAQVDTMGPSAAVDATEKAYKCIARLVELRQVLDGGSCINDNVVEIRWLSKDEEGSDEATG